MSQPGFVVGVGGGVFLPGALCRRLGALLRRGDQLAQIADGTSLPALGEVLALLEQGAAVHSTAVQHAVSQLHMSSAPGTAVDTGRSDPSPSKWITSAEAAELLGCTDRWVRRLASQGRLKARRAGRGAWEVDAAAVVERQEGGRDGAPARGKPAPADPDGVEARR